MMIVIFIKRHKWTEKELGRTLNLPKKSFLLRPDHGKLEERFRKSISFDWYQTQPTIEEGRGTFILHDGPPFANGELHIGHALNKMLKDIILRQKSKLGHRVEMRPGWDCHGLPIEQKALKEDSTRTQTPPSLIRSRCRQFALDAIQRQAQDMQKWGLLMDYSNPVRTMDPEYEGRQMRIFGEFVKRGLVFSDRRPVHWSPSSQTALAEAELEYKDDHRSMAIYYKFPIEGFFNGEDRRQIYALIWTTTPWTIPSNQAIAFNPNLEYVLVEKTSHVGTSGGDLFIVAISRLADLPFTSRILSSFDPNAFSSLHYTTHPRDGQAYRPFFANDFVTGDSGTGLVHLAPAHGQDDFSLCRNGGIKERLLVTPDGRFSSDCSALLRGKSIFDNEVIREYLEDGIVHLDTNHIHRYPYDWRTRKPIIQMVTKQWFIDISSIKSQLEAALSMVKFIPESGHRRLLNMISSRSQWCISRQRHWGLPIPAFANPNGESFLKWDIVQHVSKLFSQHGSDIWWEEMADDALLPEAYRGQGLKRTFDTMDVWFDSGTFWSINDSTPADIYIEGSDQHRGWFQSSLITSVVMGNGAPFRTLISHGFVLDEKGVKMSKSLGNVLSPNQAVNGESVDLLRLWAALSNYQNDIHIGTNSIKHIRDVYSKIRNTFKFIVGNIEDLVEDHVDFSSVRQLDKFYLRRTKRVIEEVEENMNKYDFAKAMGVFFDFINQDLSAIYFDCIKNRLYADARQSPGRRSAQSTLLTMAHSLITTIKPIMPFFSAEIEEFLQRIPAKSRRLCESLVLEEHEETKWKNLLFARSQVLEIIARLKKEKLAASSFEVHLSIENPLVGLEPLDLAELFMVSKVGPFDRGQVLGEIDNKTIGKISILKSEGRKCPRCWIYRLSAVHDQSIRVCEPCHDALIKDGYIQGDGQSSAEMIPLQYTSQ